MRPQPAVLQLCTVGLLLVTGPLAIAQDASLSISLKPAFHITPEVGWMNDPNGMFWHNGSVHAFFQWNPRVPVLGHQYWAHVVSCDLAHWHRLPVGLIPDTLYDYDGVFSGSASIQPNGQPLLLYTGVSRHSELGFNYQVQAMAVPASPTDMTFQRWIKSPITMPLPQNGTPAQFRDPQAAFQPKGSDTYYTTVGTQVDCIGTASLYSSTDLRSGVWEHVGVLASQIGLGLGPNTTCKEPPTQQKGMCKCDQYGTDCYMWECPDYFEVPGAFVMKWSDQMRVGSSIVSADRYVVTDQAPDFTDVHRLNSSAGIFRPCFRGQVTRARLIDYGSIYASATFDAGGRQLWAGWAYETSVNCKDTCINGTSFTNAMGWQGVQTLLRQVSLDEATGALIMTPIPELSLLRQQLLFSGPVTILRHATSTENDFIWSGQEHQLEVVANFSVPADAGTFGAGIKLTTGHGKVTLIGFTGLLEVGTDSSLQISKASVYIDRSRTGGMTKTTVEGGEIVIPDGFFARPLDLIIFIDRSIVEVFAWGGRARVTSRIYPDSTETWGLTTFGSHSEVVVWSLHNAFDNVHLPAS